MATHKADARALLDDRGYSGPLIRGQSPATLFEKAVRDRITESYYFKEQCFGLNAATLCDRAVEMAFIGGTYGAMGKPTPFLCLAFKLAQLVPDRKIILEYLNFVDYEPEGGDEDDENKYEGNIDEIPVEKRGEFKYLRALAAFYIRLAWEPVEIYKTLEPLLSDSRKLKRRIREGFALSHMDEFVDDLLTKDRVCATSLWKLPNRAMLEDLDMLEPRQSPLQDELDELEQSGDEHDDDANGTNGKHHGHDDTDESRSPPSNGNSSND